VKRLSFIILASLLCLLFAPQTTNARSCAMLSVTNWDDNCNTTLENLPEWNNMITRWSLEIQHSSHGSRAFDDEYIWQVDGNLSQNHLTDISVEAFGKDHYYIDHVDAAIVGMHGSNLHWNSNWGGYPRHRGNNECDIDPSDNEMEVGDGQNENLILSSCHSLNRNYCENGNWSEWNQMFDGMQALNGYHGTMWIASHLRGEHTAFADDGFDIPVSTAFVENLYVVFYHDGGYVYQCPVHVSAGATTSQAISLRDNYDYYSWGSDPTGNGHWARLGVSGCNPEGQGAY